MCTGCGVACVLNSSASSPIPPVTGSDFCARSGDDGTIMYMTGFVWTSMAPDMECLSLFFGPWLLDRPWKLALACIGVALLGIVAEFLLLARRFLSRKRQGDLGFILHLANLCIAYLVMLVIMMYSVELFLSTIAGLFIGHISTVRLGQRLRRNEGAEAESFVHCEGGELCCRLTLDDPLLQNSYTTQNKPPSAAPSSTSALETASGSVAPLEMEEVQLAVQGMTCSACVNTISRALRVIKGVSKVDVSLEKNTAVVGYVHPADPAQLCRAVEAVGFVACVDRR